MSMFGDDPCLGFLEDAGATAILNGENKKWKNLFNYLKKSIAYRRQVIDKFSY